MMAQKSDGEASGDSRLWAMGFSAVALMIAAGLWMQSISGQAANEPPVRKLCIAGIVEYLTSPGSFQIVHEKAGSLRYGVVFDSQNGFGALGRSEVTCMVNGEGRLYYLMWDDKLVDPVPFEERARASIERAKKFE